MPTQPITVDQFAAKIKAKYPQYAEIPDAQLVQKVVAKYPQYKAQIGGALPSPPGAPSVPKDEPQSFGNRTLDRVTQNLDSMRSMPGNITDEARKRFLARHPENASQSTTDKLKSLPSTGFDALKSMFEGAYYGGAEPAAKGAYSVSTPGLIQRVGNKEDAANIAGDALMQFSPGGEEAARAIDPVRSTIDPTKSSGLRGSMTRGQQLMDQVDAAAKDIPVDHTRAYEWAKKAEALQPYGYTVPAPVKAFIDMVESRSKRGVDAMSKGSFMDRGASMHPLRYEDARNFEQSLGDGIPWDQDPGGKMNGIMKKMRESIGQDTAAALKPHGLDIPYLKAKSEFVKAYGAERKWGPFGYFGGKLAGYGAGAFTGHPLMMGYGGGKLGEHAAGSLVRSVVNAGGKGQ